MLRINNLKVNLEQKIFQSDKVFIMPHINADFDAIASSVGMSLYVSHLDKDNYVYIGDILCKLENGVQVMIDECQEKYPIIGQKQYEQLKRNNAFNILCDVNKPQRTYEKVIDRNHLAIIDHHNKDDETFDACIEHINPAASSASEIVTELLASSKIKNPKDLANMLYAGILLDTNKLRKNINGNTHRTIGKLIDHGATRDEAEEYFTEDVFSNKRVEKLVEKAQFLNYRIGLTVGEEGIEYKRDELARAADALLTSKVDATFAIGYIGEGVVSISARSKDTVDSGKVMGELKGGGGQTSAATELTNANVDETVKELKKIILPKHYIIKDE